jgi:GH15 family glucan-1,4-alpha-glucosidase
MKINFKLILILQIVLVVSNPVGANQKKELADKIKKDQYFSFVKAKALEVMKTGFNAGDGYREVWIRDYNTFIQLAAQVNDKAILKENLLVFFRMQGEDGNIIDGFTPIKEIGKEEYDFIYSKLEPRYAGHKNSVETDQESSLVQALYKYVTITGDQTILDETIGDKKVGERLEFAMNFLINQRFNQKYGLLIGATTADWGDVQPEHGWGVDLDANTHPAIDIYDNAMFLIALNNMMELLPKTKDKWAKIRNRISENSRKYLWDTKTQKFIPHLYLEKGSPFPADFDENKIYYFGGTAIAIEAGLLNKKEIRSSLEEMIKRVKLAGAGSIGLTLYPPYPKDFFVNKIMNPEYSYQNGGDWTWFGGRMIQQLIRNGFVEEAYEQMIPMVKRVKDNNGFFEWYSVDNKPRGSGTFRGEAGVLFTAITMFEDWIK